MSRTFSESIVKQRAEILVDLLLLAVLALFFISYLPLDILRHSPAAGGDLGSHFWPIKTLLDYGIPNTDFPVWNPGNNGGEAQLLHYFPLPFFLIAGLSLFLPLGMAFNFGVLLPLLLFPLATYVCARCLGFKFPGPLLAACAAQTFTLNESYQIWGGNALSTLAGQFAHQYAFLFFALGIGALCFELRMRRKVFFSALMFAAVTASHPYVALCLPIVALSIAFAYPALTLKERFNHIFRCGVWSLLLSVWFLIPLIDNQQWTTPLSMIWDRTGLWRKALPLLFVPWLLLGLLSLITLCLFYRERNRTPLLGAVALCGLALSLFYGVGFFVFPRFGLVDVRAIPQIQYFLLFVSALAIGEVITLFRMRYRLFGGAALVVVGMFWLSGFVVNFGSWAAWNFSGWESKKAFTHLEKLYTEIRGDFDDARIVYEHSPLNHFAGSVRVFEMLPYFSGRSTLESVYTQSTILSRSIYLLQSEVSKSPSCPFSLSPCHSRDIENAIDKMLLLGVGSFIAIEPSTVAEAMTVPELKLRKRFGPWRVFDLLTKPSYVGHMRESPILVEGANWRGYFDTWFANYSKPQDQNGRRFLIAKRTISSPLLTELDEDIDLHWLAPEDCRSDVEVGFSGLKLRTDCPGYVHYLAFAYHPTWAASTGDELFAVSPGFIGIVPSKAIVELRFGQSKLWQFAHLVSLLSLSAILVLGLGRKCIHKGRTPESNGSS